MTTPDRSEPTGPAYVIRRGYPGPDARFYVLPSVTGQAWTPDPMAAHRFEDPAAAELLAEDLADCLAHSGRAAPVEVAELLALA